MFGQQLSVRPGQLALSVQLVFGGQMSLIPYVLTVYMYMILYINFQKHTNNKISSITLKLWILQRASK